MNPANASKASFPGPQDPFHDPFLEPAAGHPSTTTDGQPADDLEPTLRAFFAEEIPIPPDALRWLSSGEIPAASWPATIHKSAASDTPIDRCGRPAWSAQVALLASGGLLAGLLALGGPTLQPTGWQPHTPAMPRPVGNQAASQDPPATWPRATAEGRMIRPTGKAPATPIP